MFIYDCIYYHTSQYVGRVLLCLSLLSLLVQVLNLVCCVSVCFMTAFVFVVRVSVWRKCACLCMCVCYVCVCCACVCLCVFGVSQM